MKRSAVCLAMCCALVAVVLLEEAAVAVNAVTCNPLQLSACAGAITSPGSQPSAACCNKLREQRPCLCGYSRNPSLRQYINSPGAKRVASACRVSVKC